MSKRRVCDARDCTKIAKWNIVLEFRAPGADEFTSPFQSAVLDLACCDDCRKKTKAETVLTDKSWDDIYRLFRELGVPQPDRERVRLGFRSLSYGN